MHLVIPFAAPLSDAGRQVLASLQLPALSAFIARATETGRDEGDELSLSPPHERAIAHVLGWLAGDGQLPWAAHEAAATGLDVADKAWARLTPVHWFVGTDQVSLADPAVLALDETGSRALLAAVQELFSSEGFELHYAAPTCWLAAHHSFDGLATASPDRVIGRNVDRWLTGGVAARLIRRLQNEVQMQLHEHPLNEAREARGQLPVNSFWLSGCGRAQAARGPAPSVDARLRSPALADDWAAWLRAWETLDAGPVADLLAAAARGEAPTLTLCGERSSLTFQSRPPGLWQRVEAIWRRPALQPLLEAL